MLLCPWDFPADIVCEPELNIVAFNHPSMDTNVLAEKLEELGWKVSVAKCPVAIRVVLMNHIKTSHIKELLEDLKEIVPDFYIANATIHFDEHSPHMHIVGVPVKENCKTFIVRKWKLQKAH